MGIRWPITRSEIDIGLDRVGAQEWGNRPVLYAIGWTKKAVLPLQGLALMIVPLWLLDEPTTNLDREGQGLVGTLIEEHLERGVDWW